MEEPTSVYIKPISHLMCFIFRIFGLWKPYGKSKTTIIAYSVYAVIFLFTFSTVYSILMVCNIFFLTDSSDLTNRLYMSLTETAAAIKIINFFINNREWQLVLTKIGEFRIKSEKDAKNIQKRARILQIAFYVYILTSNVTILTWAILPLSSGAKELIYSGWYPGLDWVNSRRDYWITYSYQEIGIIITCNLNVTIDSYYCFLMYIISGQVNIFGKYLSEIQAANGENASHRIRLNLIEKIHLHQRLNGNLALIQKNLQWTYFCQVLLSSIVICSVTKESATVIIIQLFK